MTSVAGTAPLSGLEAPRRQLAMLTICLGVVLSGFDFSMANVALPALARELHASASATIWVATAYQLGVVVSLLPFSAAGEALGYRRVYLAGMAVFTAASLGCAFSTSLPALATMRGLQGLGGGAMIGVSLALVRFSFPRERLGRALALYGLTAAAALTAGPPLGAAILTIAPWPWLFLVNAPIGLVALALGSRVLPDSPRLPRRLDLAGALCTAVVLALLIVSVDGLGDPERIGLAALGVALALGLGAVLIRWQARQTAALVPVDLLRLPAFSLAAATAVCIYAAQTAAFVALPFQLITLLGRSQAATGLLIAPFPAMIVLAAPVGGRLADRYSAGKLGMIGAVVLGLGFALLATLPPGASDLGVALRTALCGVGFGFFQAPNNRAMMVAAPPERSGAASALVAMARVGGQAFGSAAAAVALGLFHAGGASAALWVSVGCAAAAGALCLVRATAPA